MANTISVGQLRKNPTQMLRDVRNGATYTVTDHGEPVAEVSPTAQHRWVSSEDFNDLLHRLRELGDGADAASWMRDIEDMRDAELVRDPWEGRE